MQQLTEEQRQKLDGIVQQMINNSESEANIQFVVNDFKSKYGGKTDAAAGETATVVADQPSELGLQSENGLSEQQVEPEVPTWLEETFGQDTFGVDFASDMYRAVKSGWRQSSAAGEIADVFAGDVSDEKLNVYRDSIKYIQDTAQSEEMQNYQRNVQKYKDEGDGGFLAGLKAFVKNPSIGPEVMLSSLSQMVGTAAEGGAVSGLVAGGAATGAAVGAPTGIGAVAGAVAGAQGSAMMAMESLNTFSELLQEKVKDNNGNFDNNEDLRKVLNDEDQMSDLYRKAIGRGVAIGAIEALSGGIAGKVGAVAGKGLSKLKKVGRLASAVGVEAVGGSLGETAGMLAAGQELAGEEIFLEGIAGTAMAPVSIAAQTFTGNPQYVVNGKKTKQNEGKAIIKDMVANSTDEEFAGMRVKVKNDDKLAEEVQNRRRKIITENKEAVKKKIQPEVDSDLKAKLKLKLKKSKAQLKEVRETDGDAAAEAFEIQIDKLEKQLKKVDDYIDFQLDELNEDEMLDLMNMDDDISLYQSILNDPSSSETAKEAAKQQLEVLKSAQLLTVANTDSADMANPEGPQKKKNIDLSKKTQEAYEKKGKNSWGEVSELQQGLIRSIATSFWSKIAPDKKIGTYDDFVAALTTGKGGLRDLVRTYDPSTGVPLAAYLANKKSGLRVRANRLVKGLAKQDIDKGLDSKEALSQYSEGIDVDKIDLGPEFLHQKLGLGKELGDLTNDVEIGLQKTILELEKLGEVTQKKRQAEAEKAFNSIFTNKYDKAIKKFIGSNTKNNDSFSKFINNNFETLRTIALGNIDFQKGKGISKHWNKYPPSKQDFLDYYEAKNEQASTRNDRKNKLVKAIESQLAADARKSYFESRQAEQEAFNIEQQISFQQAPQEVKKIRIFDFDDTLAKSNSQVLYTLPDGTTGKLNATEYAKRDQELKDKGATFDFSEFSKVIDGKKGPLFEVAQKINAARGNEDLFVLTARPADSAGPIQEFLKLAGLDFRKENIIGLGDGTAQAKADWVQGKINEGYNDFYFADDAIKNVDAVKNALDNADVKGKVQQAKAYQEAVEEITAGSVEVMPEAPQGDLEGQLDDFRDLAETLGLGRLERTSNEIRKKVHEGLMNLAKQGRLSLEALDWFKMGSRGRKKVDGQRVDMPAGGGIYFNQTDPTYIDLKNAIIASNAKPNTKIKPLAVTPEATTKGTKAYTENQKRQAQNDKAFSEFIGFIDEIMQEDVLLAAILIHDASAATDGIIKVVAPLRYTTKNLEFGTEGTKYGSDYKKNAVRNWRDEHTMTASTVANYIGIAAKKAKNGARSILPLIKKQYFRTLLSLKYDEIVEKGGFASTMQKTFRLIYSNTLGRYFNDSTNSIMGGMDPTNLVNIETGQTVAEEFGFKERSGVLLNLELTEQFKDKTPDKIQSKIELQEDSIPDPELSGNERVEALSDLLQSAYGTNVFKTKDEAIEYLVGLGVSKQKAEGYTNQKGFRLPGAIFINEEKAGVDTAMHEFTHEWADLVNDKDPDLFNAIYDKLRAHPRFESAIKRMADSDIYSLYEVDSFKYKNEVMAHILGEEGKSLYELFEGDTEAKTLIDKFFDYVREALGFDPTIKNFADLTVEEVTKLAVKDILEGNPAANFDKLQNVAEGKSWFQKSEASISKSAKAKSDPIVRALNKLKLSYRENKNLAQAINDAYTEVEGMMEFIDFVRLISKNTKEVPAGKSKMLLIGKAELIKADKIAQESAKKQAEDKVNEEQASKLQSMFRRIIYQAKGEGAKASRWFIPPNAEDFKGLLYAFLPKGQLGLDARKWMEENLLKPYSNGIATLDTEILHKSKAWTDMSKGFNFEEKVGGTPYTLGDAIKVYNALKEGVDPGIAKKKHLDALIHAVESNSEVLDLANEVAESFPIKLESGWQTRAFAKEIYDSINNGARKRHLETFSNNVDAVFTDATLDLIADQYGEKYRQAIVSTLRRMKSGRNRVSTDANANSYMNWLNRAVGTTMFLNTRSAILQLLSTLNFLGKPGNNIFQATAAFANQKQWKADYNKLWNSDYLSNRRDGAKFDVLADEIAEGPQGLNKILKFGFLPTRYADSFAIALGGAAYYRNRVNMLMKEGMSEADAEAQAMIDWRNTAEESQQSSDPSKISEIQASSIGKIIYAFANTPFQYARITKRKLQDITSGRSAAAGTLRTDMQSILYYSVGQAIMFNALQSGLVALLNSDDPEDEEMKEEKYALMLERTLTSFAKSTGNPGAVASTLYAMMKEGYMQQTGKKRPDANAFAITATSISPPLNSKMRDLAGAYRAFNKIEEGDTFTPSLDNEALTMAGEVASFGGVPLDRVIRKARHLAAIKNEEAELWQKIWMLAGWSSWELGVKESKDTEFKAMDFKDVDFKEVEFKESAFKKLENGIAGRANNDGTIEIDPNLSPVERAKTIAHEKQHMKDMKAGKLNYDDNYVYWNESKYERKNGKIIYKGKSYIEGHPSLPWEKKAYNAEPSTKEIKRKKLYA